MSWVSLKDRLEALPWIICGPILRRVESRSVTVWLATRVEVDLQIEIYREVLRPAPLDGRWITDHRPMRVGPHLWLHLVTASLADAEPSPLGANESVRYNLKLTHDGETRELLDVNATQGDALAGSMTPGEATKAYVVVGGLSRSLNSGDRPIFEFPPGNTNIRVAHGSCRKPSGEGSDALAALDELVRAQGGAEFPHLLALTGDQIYADGVSDTLLFLILDAVDALLDWRDPIPAPHDLNDAAHRDDLGNLLTLPGYRALWARKAGFDQTYPPRSHLFRVCEYLMMYLFCWSDVLWPAALPSREDLLGTEVPYAGQRLWFLQHWSSTHEAERRWDVEALQRFQSTLPSVRRVLANLPTYMLLDDHDVTDDWFVSPWWTQNAAQDPLARHTVRSAMVAGWLCQIVGNDPAVLDTVEGGTLWAHIGNLFDAGGRPDANVTLELDRLFGLPMSAAAPALETRSLVPFHFRVVYGDVELIGLDTRCNRAFADMADSTSQPFPLLLDPDARPMGSLAVQLPTVDVSSDWPGAFLSIIVSPAPVFGSALLEEIQKVYGSQTIDDFNTFAKDYALPFEMSLPFGLDLSLAQRLAYKDTEAWGLQDAAREALLSRIVARYTGQRPDFFPRVVILSGDVHYASSWRVELAARARYRDNGMGRAVIAQMTSSSLRNESSLATRELTPEGVCWIAPDGTATDPAHGEALKVFERGCNADMGAGVGDGYGAVTNSTVLLHMISAFTGLANEHHVGATNLANSGWNPADGWRNARASEQAVAKVFPRVIEKQVETATGFKLDLTRLDQYFTLCQPKGKTPCVIRDAGFLGMVRSYIGVTPLLPAEWVYWVEQLNGEQASVAGRRSTLDALADVGVDCVNFANGWLGMGSLADLYNRLRGADDSELLHYPGDPVVGYNNVGLVSFDNTLGVTVTHRVFWSIDDAGCAEKVTRWSASLEPTPGTLDEFISRTVTALSAPA